MGKKVNKDLSNASNENTEYDVDKFNVEEVALECQEDFDKQMDVLNKAFMSYTNAMKTAEKKRKQVVEHIRGVQSKYRKKFNLDKDEDELDNLELDDLSHDEDNESDKKKKKLDSNDDADEDEDEDDDEGADMYIVVSMDVDVDEDEATAVLLDDDDDNDNLLN